MFACPLFSCLHRSESASKSKPVKKAKRIVKKEKDAKPMPLSKRMSENGRSLPGDTVSDLSYAQLNFDYDEPLVQANARKPMVVTSHSEDTLSTLFHAKCDHTYVNRRSRKLLKPFTYNNITQQEKKEFSFGTGHYETTMLSDWGDYYEDDDIRMSASNMGHAHADDWSEGASLYSAYPRLGSTAVIKVMAPMQEMPVSPGKVWATLFTKTAKTSQLLNLNISLQEVVDTFLKAQTGESLPISLTLSSDTRPKILPAKKMGMKLSESLKGHLDETTQGLTFFVGPINSKLCYKLYVSDMEQLQKLFVSSN